MSAIQIRVFDNTQAFTRGKNEATLAILDMIGNNAVQNAREYVPRPGHSYGYATGALRDSIGYETTDRSVLLYATQPYAAYVELGTSDPNYPVQPYLQPAIYNHQEEYKSIAESIYRGDKVINPTRHIVYMD